MTFTLIAITLLAVASAVVSARVTWRYAAEQRRRSAARVAGLADAIRPSSAGASLPGADDVDQLFEAEEPLAARTTWIALGGAVAAGVLLGIALNISHLSGDTRPAPAPAESVAPVRDLPLELVALRDERHDNRLTIHGVIRNPAAASGIAHVTAVVLLFNQQGGFLTSGRATIDSDALAPGGESAFEVTIPDAADVGRYRVSFRDDLRVIPHVDRRAS